MKIKSFSKSKLSFHLPDLLAVQKESWQCFWQRDLPELLREIFPITDYTGKQFELNLKNPKLGEPKYKNGLQAREENDSFEAPLRVKAILRNLKTKEVKEQEVFLANIPLMTENSSFVVNGVERVIISQLIRSPGVFFSCRVYVLKY